MTKDVADVIAALLGCEMKKIDVTALRDAVTRADPDSRVVRFDPPNADTVKIDRPSRYGMAIYVRGYPTSAPMECVIVKTKRDRAILRAVLDELDRQEDV